MKYYIRGEEGFAGWHGISHFPGAQVTRGEWERTWRDLAEMGCAPRKIPRGEGGWEFQYRNAYGDRIWGYLMKKR